MPRLYTYGNVSCKEFRGNDFSDAAALTPSATTPLLDLPE
jgi:hypothetical protein